MRSADSDSRCVLRIRTDYKCFYSDAPHDSNCDETKHGTGFIVTGVCDRPCVLTAHHVVNNAVNITCTSPFFGDGESYDMRLYGYNAELDVAVLHVPDGMLNAIRPLVAGTSSTLFPGQQLRCVGFAGDSARPARVHTTTGTVSGRSEWPHNRIQTDTVINPGNSGGPIFEVETGKVVGIVTSGMNEMQPTNFFVGIDEARGCVSRMSRICKMTTSKKPVVDLGLALNAIVKSVSSTACQGLEGGALVVAADAQTRLKENDVIVAVHGKDGKPCKLNAFMRVRDDKVWEHDAVDFRTLIDAIDFGENPTWKMKVRRFGKTILIDVPLSPSTIAFIPSLPDCAGVKYVAFGGLVIQLAHIALETVHNSRFRNPQDRLRSFPVITYATASSPFGRTEDVHLLGGRVVKINGGAVDTLDDVLAAVSARNPGQHWTITIDSGARVGCDVEALARYEEEENDPNIARGMHVAKRGLI